MKNYKELLKNITTFVFDIDGVLAKSSVIVFSENEPLRLINVKDGYAIQFAIKKGYNICVISGGSSEAMRERLNLLGIKNVYMKVHNKLSVIEEYAETNGIDYKNILYMGDDIPDYEAMKKVGLPTCPKDASQEIKSIQLYISNIRGGDGCVRDVIEQVLKIKNEWMDNEAFHW